MTLSITSTLPLNDGGAIPRFGLGTFLSEAGNETKNAVLWALEEGYRHIDTARVYGNERDVGAAIRESGVSRSDIFVTTKVWNDDQGYDAALKACEKSLERLGMDYVDLYLIHWPVPDLRNDTWRALVELRRTGKVRSIGVSNFMIRHLEELLATTDVVPAVNQVEISPFIQRKELTAYCRERGIVVESYSTLGRGERTGDERLAAVGGPYGRTPAQVALRWALQAGFVVIPKSVHRERILENAAVFDFELSDADMERIAGFDENASVTPPSWDPETSEKWR
ncbi:MAG: glyoxal reductase [delta proteobacterium MLS_D]|jgi:methylglyoxal/glyoxal reductase|nr:MAG: glyoxal reductase [delta proteobacterium MLS_D]